MAETGKGQLVAQGEALRKAVRWLAERRREEPQASRVKLLDEAALRFDLSPNEVEYLLEHWNAP